MVCQIDARYDTKMPNNYDGCCQRFEVVIMRKVRATWVLIVVSVMGCDPSTTSRSTVHSLAAILNSGFYENVWHDENGLIP